jgi:hypothetical protein
MLKCWYCMSLHSSICQHSWVLPNREKLTFVVSCAPFWVQRVGVTNFFYSIALTEQRQSSDCRFLANNPSWWKNHPWLVRKSCNVRSCWEGRYTPSISSQTLYVLSGIPERTALAGFCFATRALRAPVFLSSLAREVAASLYRENPRISRFRKIRENVSPSLMQYVMQLQVALCESNWFLGKAKTKYSPSNPPSRISPIHAWSRQDFTVT